MNEFPIMGGDFVAVTATALTSRGAEIPLDADRDGVIEAAALTSSGEVVLLEGLRSITASGAPQQTAPSNTKTFATQIASPTNLSFGDIDGDGTPDLIVTTTSLLTVFFNDRQGSFGTPLSSSAAEITKVALADFNGDSKLDIATVDTLGIKTIRGNNSRIALNPWVSSANLSTSFLFTSPLQLRVVYPSTKKLPGLAIGGLSSGFLTYSLIVVDTASTPSSIRFSASANRAFLLSSSISSLERADLTGDGLQDLLTLRNESGDITVMQNTGSSYRDLQSVRVLNSALPYSPLTALGDFLLESRTSLLVSIPKARSVKLYSWIGNALSTMGTVSTRGELNYLSTPQDIDKDGDLDVLSIGTYDGGTHITLLRNDKLVDRCGRPPSEILAPGAAVAALD